ncbi:ACP S-malonyltransferase [Streptomyces marispadix]|uniref:[acyl-carrier-protein] S-malonyltransferase n=1 Tax=Streptomyces marispadix TaxID=2922868 RepID=A0ABS9SX39_9ACTN|nr:ACP S-malonyltransferase [Streptomyces marispadix]MCH6160827.1 ACP S-malonyltransferase [Streptomyces marispadix]
MEAVVFPGQGAQARGMGRELFDAFPELTERASDILGYSVRELCVEDPRRLLRSTQYTQPALFVVGALAHRRRQTETGRRPAYFAGHSVGEYCALHAAGAFDFATGLRLVQRRGDLMARAEGGGMAAVLGLDAGELTELLQRGGFTSLTLANDNAPAQQVVSGAADEIAALDAHLHERGVRCVRLNVSGAFHSPLMRPAQEAFEEYVRGFSLGDPRTPVISNVTASPYPPGRTAELLVEQIASPVRWTDTVRRLLELGVEEFTELGGNVVGKLIQQTRDVPRPAPAPEPPSALPAAAAQARTTPVPTPVADPPPSPAPALSPAASPAPRPVSGAATLGSAVFRTRLGLRYSYAAGGMYRGIASPAMVIRLARAGMLGFLGTGGLTPAAIEENILEVQRELRAGEPFGVNFLADHDDPAAERRVAEMLLRRGVTVVEAAAFIQMTPALVLYRARGMSRAADGAPKCAHRILAKVSRPEVARAFMSPAPVKVVDGLLREGAITPEQADLVRQVPMSHDITVEADSGGHTDGGIATVMLPAMLGLRREAQRTHGYPEPVCMGLAGGLGTPEAVASAFMLGADYVLTGSVNQCTVEAATSDAVKDMLQNIDIQDTGYAPAGDMFEMGARVQVLRKGVFFPTRANKLYSLYQQYDGLDQLPAKTRALLEKSYFHRTLDEIWAEVCDHYRGKGEPGVVEKAAQQPKLRMALVFRWYFAYSARLALTGQPGDKVNYQVHTGPALGAFNQWVKGTATEPWQARHADSIGLMLLEGAAEHMAAAYESWGDTSRFTAERPPAIAAART